MSLNIVLDCRNGVRTASTRTIFGRSGLENVFLVVADVVELEKQHDIVYSGLIRHISLRFMDNKQRDICLNSATT